MGTVAETTVATGILSTWADEARRQPGQRASMGKPRAHSGWNPERLIKEDDNGEPYFCADVARAPERNRRQALLLYREGQQIQSLVNARKWREVSSQCSPEEESRLRHLRRVWVSPAVAFHANSHRGAQVPIVQQAVAERESLYRKRNAELKKRSPDPLKLDRWETRLRETQSLLAEYDILIAILTVRERHFWTVLLDCEREERTANGWKLKAKRQVACGLYGRRLDGGLCGAPRCFRRFRCHNRYCTDCGPLHHQELLKQYLVLEKFADEYVAAHPAYGLKILDLTFTKRGQGMPTGQHVRWAKGCIKRLIRRMANHLGVKVGYVYCLEFGFENNNLHCHGLLLSPYTEQALLSNWWREICADGSFRVLIATARDFKAGLAHALEYTGKYAASTPERAVELERAFQGCRRVDGLGLFFNRLPERKEAVDLHCPCGDPNCFLVERTDLGWWPIEYFERQGIPDLDELRASRASPRWNNEAKNVSVH